MSDSPSAGNFASNPKDDGALIVFAREPIAGKVKTRLARRIGVAAATNIYDSLLTRTLSRAQASLFPNRYLFASADSEVEYFRSRLDPQIWRLSSQCNGDIGKRMDSAIASTLAQHAFVVLIGSDIADCETQDLDIAYRLLRNDGGQIVVGPTADGGYWLIGTGRTISSVFADIPWSTNSVFTTTHARIAALGIRPEILQQRHDIDEVDDLRFISQG